MHLDLLIVEDNSQEAVYAEQLAKARFSSVAVVSDADEAMVLLNHKPRYALFDLFFPAGQSARAWVDEILPIYTKWVNDNFPATGEHPFKATYAAAKDAGLSPYEFASRLSDVSVESSPGALILGILVGRTNAAKYLKYDTFLQELQKGMNFPSGYFLASEALRKDVRCAIVTSSHHHDAEFAPIANGMLFGKLNRIQYFDKMVGQHKDWQSGMDYLVMK